MSIRLNIALRRLHRLLGTVGDDAFFALCWAAHAFQSGRQKKAAKFYEFPAIAVGDIRTSKAPIFPWMIETLLNELLIAEKNFGSFPRLAERSFFGIAEASDALAEVEDIAHTTLPESARGIPMLGRISQRQFEWQRGDISLPMLYRAHYLYGGELFKSHFLAKYGISLDSFSFACFATFAIAQEAPFFSIPDNVSVPGLSPDLLRAVLDRIALPISVARTQASEIRSEGNDPAYKPSILRQYPCILFENDYCAPLPSLVVRRATSGLFYDLAGAEGSIRNEVAGRFEQYCKVLLGSMLSPMQIHPEFQYRVGRRPFASPDILAFEQSEIRLVIECKAVRMPVPAKFAAKPQVADAGGYKELAHGIFQIWRFASHCRRGLVDGNRCAEGSLGLVVTLDTWLSMAHEATDQVFALAHQEADRSADIEVQDRIPVVFSSIDDLESALSFSTPAQFVECVQAASTPEYRNWILPSIRRHIALPLRNQRPYPFKRSIGQVVPWWRELDKTNRD